MDETSSILTAIQNMDKQALIQVFDLYAPRLYRYAVSACRDPIKADDVVAEVFRKLLEALKSGRGPRKNLKAYLFQIAYHEIVNQARVNERSSDLSDDLPAREDEIPPVKYEENEENARLYEAVLSVLNDDQRNVVALRFFEEFSITETSQILGKSINNIKVIQSRAIAKLRQVLVK